MASETLEQRSQRQALEAQQKLQAEEQKKKERAERSAIFRAPGERAGVTRGGERITQDRSGQGLTAQSEWDKLFKNTATNNFGRPDAEGNIVENTAYRGMAPNTPMLASRIKPQFPTGSKSAPEQFAGVGDSVIEPKEEMFGDVSDEGLNLTIGMEQFGGFQNSAQKFETDGNAIFQGLPRPRKPLLTSRKTESSLGNASLAPLAGW